MGIPSCTHTQEKRTDLSTTARKSQSAMEYLMTYGWAIIVILAAVYILNVFTPGKILGNQCNVNFQ